MANDSARDGMDAPSGTPRFATSPSARALHSSPVNGEEGVQRVPPGASRPSRESSYLPYGARVAMEPAGFALACRVSGGETFDIKLDGWFASLDDKRAGVEASFDGEVLELAIVPAESLVVQSCCIFLRHAFTHAEKVLLNGYQSWTDTVERTPWTRMRGLKGVPQYVIDRYALDGGGDYRFTEYPNVPGKQHGWTYATFRRDEGMVLVGSLDEDRGFTLIRTDAAAGSVELYPECPQRILEVGERVVLGRFAITRGVLDECYDRWFALLGVKPRTDKPLVGYSSWYRHYDGIDEGKLLSDLAGAQKAFDRGEASLESFLAETRDGDTAWPYLKAFQIDDGYCKVGDWLDVDAQKFPRGLEPLARAASEAGFLPGLWVSPFVCERDSHVFVEHDDWLLHDAVGNPVSTGCHWSGGFALDTRNPEVRSYVLDVLQTITGTWGFRMLKIDFLYAACMFPHDGFNRGQLMADALDLIRLGVGDDCLLLGCGVPIGSAMGRVDFCRVGCDVGLNWDDTPIMRLLHRERVSTKNSLANTYGRAPLDGRAFGGDPDVFFLRPDVKLTDIQRDELLFADAGSGSVFLTSDDIGSWSDDMLKRFQMALRLLLERKGLV